MTRFQWIFLTLISGGLFREVWVFWRDTEERRASSTRMAVLFAAAIAIAAPSLIQAIAQRVGIARGADLVLYLFTAAFLVVTFYFYTRNVVLQRQITSIVRQYAIREASPPSGLPPPVQMARGAAPDLRVFGHGAPRIAERESGTTGAA